ncbi:MAG: polyphosphate polymerase domain-containing protein [Huintestinicola sp.]
MKYLLTPGQYSELRNMLSGRMEQDQYGFHTICSIYFDSCDDHIIRTSLNKPVYKEKLRLRSYGVPADGSSQVFLELKKKYKGVVYKRRIPMTLETAENYIYRNIPPEQSQIFNEIDYFRKLYNVYPKIFIGYDRIALYSTEDNDLRLTFDFNIRCRRDRLRLTDGDEGSFIIPEGYALMEIKIAQAMPLWLADILTELKIYPVSFSKYGEFYKRELASKNNIKGEISQCSTVS